MKQWIPACLLVALACARAGAAYKILVVFPMPARSHSLLGEGVVRHLAAAGHEITFITPFPNKNAPPNVRQIDVKDNFKVFEGKNVISIDRLLNKEVAVDLETMVKMMVEIHNSTYQNPGVRALLRSPGEEFHLVIAEWMFSELYVAFSGIFNAPFVWVSSMEPHWLMTRLIDQRLNPSYCADMMTASIPPFTFFERVESLILQIAGSVIVPYYGGKLEAEIYSSLTPYFKMRGREPPAYEELKYNASLILGNSHVSLGQPVSLPPNYINIGGYHIDTKVEPLPADLQNLLDNAKHGVIYFSMGSNLKSKDMPGKMKTELLKMFGTLKQTVLWKFEEKLPDLPSNVHILSWAPQASILAHPNCLVFITHGGLLSTTESIHFVKPIIGLPMFADQFVNVDRSVRKGFAKRVDLSLTMADELKAAINEVVQNPSYAKKVKELSFIYHDRPVPPGAELVHWVEHVIRTGGAPHLRSPALHVPFYQKMYLDLAALILAVLFLIRWAFRKIFMKSPKKQKTN